MNVIKVKWRNAASDLLVFTNPITPGDFTVVQLHSKRLLRFQWATRIDDA